ncbi:hypothetical protein V8G54_028022 [Vigna mungo]|uniref:phospholipase D n=1 Tax=Vigna mungo TaxID=3915 RepID=A0AAQ3MRU1_VIGMU
MSSEPLIPPSAALSTSHSFRRCGETVWIFDEMPKATVVSVSKPDTGDISSILLSYTIQLHVRPLEGRCCPHRFGSFAPIRGLTEDGSQAQWFVDGHAAFEAIATSIQDAKSEIFITGWWLCPELYLRRPFHSFSTSRLDSLLEEKAKQGVQIYVLLYKEVSLALKINSSYSMRRLLKIHENVKVLRYPDHFAARVYLWSHHEKLVIIDYKICYIGGLDLCFGRYDTPEHKVGDCPSVIWPGKDYYNPRESEPNSWEDTMRDELNRKKYPRIIYIETSFDFAKSLQWSHQAFCSGPWRVYVHSKLMIIDDRVSFIGSSNINDRSLLGLRDSEIGVLIEDKECVESLMNGKPWKAGKFSYSLRCSLWSEHLGLHTGELLGFLLPHRLLNNTTDFPRSGTAALHSIVPRPPNFHHRILLLLPPLLLTLWCGPLGRILSK